MQDRADSHYEREELIYPALTSFVYLTGGELLIKADGRTWLCSAGHLLLIPPGMPFLVHYHEDCTGFNGGFEPSILPDLSHPVLHNGEPFLYGFWFDEAAFVAELFGMMALRAGSGRTELAGKCLDILLSMMGDGSSSSGSPVVSAFLDRIFDRGNSIPNVASCAAGLGITPSYLNKLVKASTGRTASAWIDISRLNIAKALLRKGEMAVIDVAAASGLEDQSYFARFFKRNTGMTPSQYRKLFWNSNEKS